MFKTALAPLLLKTSLLKPHGSNPMAKRCQQKSAQPDSVSWRHEGRSQRLGGPEGVKLQKGQGKEIKMPAASPPSASQVCTP